MAFATDKIDILTTLAVVIYNTQFLTKSQFMNVNILNNPNNSLLFFDSSLKIKQIQPLSTAHFIHYC
ncbi:hypothetical protein [Sphaerospermopsis aphanizomenoides]|uniref:hypothetical protein n=1 Tax=Sphaerospermopsis aphanizomenoides TaxID=459663 RepID=UPI001907911F|nr:hypothetical protein [Sphaerospermopsis aphanizomenoides]